MRRQGFTLMELLVVIGIIAVLMGMLFPAIGLARKAARKAKARSQLAQIEAAMSNYRSANGLYPEGPSPSEPMTSNPLTNNPLLHLALRSVDRDNFRDNELKDPWGNPILYRPARYYPWGGSATPPSGPAAPSDDIDAADPPNPDTYQLWSSGPNGQDEKGLGDDIPTWKKRT